MLCVHALGCSSRFLFCNSNVDCRFEYVLHGVPCRYFGYSLNTEVYAVLDTVTPDDVLDMARRKVRSHHTGVL